MKHGASSAAVGPDGINPLRSRTVREELPIKVRLKPDSELSEHDVVIRLSGKGKKPYSEQGLPVRNRPFLVRSPRSKTSPVDRNFGQELLHSLVFSCSTASGSRVAPWRGLNIESTCPEFELVRIRSRRSTTRRTANGPTLRKQFFGFFCVVLGAGNIRSPQQVGPASCSQAVDHQ